MPVLHFNTSLMLCWWYFTNSISILVELNDFFIFCFFRFFEICHHATKKKSFSFLHSHRLKLVFTTNIEHRAIIHTCVHFRIILFVECWLMETFFGWNKKKKKNWFLSPPKKKFLHSTLKTSISVQYWIQLQYQHLLMNERICFKFNLSLFVLIFWLKKEKLFFFTNFSVFFFQKNYFIFFSFHSKYLFKKYNFLLIFELKKLLIEFNMIFQFKIIYFQ